MNPFKPTAGKTPPILMGREQDIADFFEGLTGGAGAPGRLMLVTGQRGFGKTVLLTEFARVARSLGWPVFLETASEGMCTRIIEALRSHLPVATGATIAPSLSLNGVGSISLGSANLSAREVSPTLRAAIEERLKHVDEGKGIFFAIDEAQAGTREEMVALATSVQLVIQQQDLNDLPDSRKKGVAFVFAGVPSVVDDLVDDKVLTFLRRCQRHDLGAIPVPDTRNGYMQTVREAGKHIEEEVALLAAVNSGGFPYMVQLIGHYMWQSSDMRGSDAIEREDVVRATNDAAYGFEEAVCAPAYRGLTNAQKEFCLAMLDDDPEASDVREVANRVKKSVAWARRYRKSLIDAHVITSAGPNMVHFEIPHLADYIRRVSDA